MFSKVTLSVNSTAFYSRSKKCSIKTEKKKTYIVEIYDIEGFRNALLQVDKEKLIVK